MKREVVLCLYACNVIGIVLSGSKDVFGDLKEEEEVVSPSPSSLANPLMVNLTLIQGADSKGAVCLDGTLPGYHFHPGYGTGENSWLIHIEGGGWCNNIKNCVYRKTSRHGSSIFMEKQLPFRGILSNNSNENPDFFNWNRVKLRYCDGASFSGDNQNEGEQLYFRGQRIWSATMEHLMASGMQNANQALLTGCSAGGLASIIHCDEFRDLFPQSTKVKCISDAGLFLDVVDISGGRTLRKIYEGVVKLQEVQKNLPSTCTSKLDPTSCFFPQNLIADIKTPLFLLNSAYDLWQIQDSLVPTSADPEGSWNNCKHDYTRCNSSQMQFLQDFRTQMVNVVKVFSMSNQNGLFIDSCFAHCQSEVQDSWLADDSPLIENKSMAQSVGDWYFDRAEVKAVDCPYPCDAIPIPPNDASPNIDISPSTGIMIIRLNLLSTLLMSLMCSKSFIRF